MSRNGNHSESRVVLNGEFNSHEVLKQRVSSENRSSWVARCVIVVAVFVALASVAVTLAVVLGLEGKTLKFFNFKHT